MARFRDREERRLIAIRDVLFDDPGQGIYDNNPRAFVLSTSEKNLWAGIRQDAADYFHRNSIGWHKTRPGKVPGHLLSSQVACVNHLYLLRQRADLASAILSAIDPEICAAEIVDDGFVEFEFIGKEQRLQEQAFTRGANCTSVDAAMIGRTALGDRRLFLIEWKYTEAYQTEDKYIHARAAVYDHLMSGALSPFVPVEPHVFYYEPFYQLMRQTLLGVLITNYGDYGCSSYCHVHVAPDENKEFHLRMTAPNIKGDTVSQAWKGMLKSSDQFISLTPRAFLTPVVGARDTKALSCYLDQRYWACV